MLAFGLGNLAPGDAATIIAGRLSDVPPSTEQIAALRHALHLDESLPVRYAWWLGNAVRGDLGHSYRTGKPVLTELLTHFPATLHIACLGFIIAVVIALPLGIVAAVNRGSWVDRMVRLTTLFGASLPNYWLGYLLIIIFALGLGWLPVAGRERTNAAVLPAVTLALGTVATLTRLMRSSLLETLNADFIRTARAKGLRERTIVVRHALKGSLLPVITILGITFGHMLGGAVVVEQIFAWSGIGKLLIDSIYDRDYPVIQGFVMFMGMVFTIINLLVDIAYPLLDPQIGSTGRQTN